MKKTLLGTGVSLLAAGLLLAGCGGGNSHDVSGTTGAPSASSPAATSPHNEVDVSFAQMMIPHHRQAIEMAALAAAQAADPPVKDLAGRIEQAQGPEIQRMTAWLAQWGATPPRSMSAMPGMDHGTAMPGIMSDGDMDKLRHATGAEFDAMFLQMMISHHQGAVDMAKTELTNGSNAEVKALAQRISDSQTAEITQMRQMLASR